MTTLTPTARAALVFLVLLTVGGVAATALILADNWQAAEQAAQRELRATAMALSATLPASQLGLDTRFSHLARTSNLDGVAVLSGEGQLLSASDRASMQQLQWGTVLRSLGAQKNTMVEWGGEDYYLAVQALGTSAQQVAVLRSADSVTSAYRPTARRLVLMAAFLWFLGVVGLGGLIWFAGSRTTARMQLVAERLSARDVLQGRRSEAVLEEARNTLGPLAEPFEVLSEHLQAAEGQRAETRQQVAALLQVNPHYVLLCTLDGHIVEANPAFYAITGLPFEAVRGNRIEVLNEVMPVEPLFELARRSAREGSSIQGIEYALISRDDVRRPVQVALRAVTVDGKEAVIIQATDVANQRNLERQISTFSDALDLMVDQRVAQLTAGNASLGRLLDDAGVVLASFDGGGSTRRWNQAAEELTGRRVQMVPHFSAFVSVLGLGTEAREAFAAWFWGPKAGSYLMEVFGTDGLVRRILWRKSIPTGEGQAERLVLIGVEAPRPSVPTGDSTGGALPHLDAIRPSDGVGVV